LQDRKWAFIRLEGKSFGDVPLNIELKLEVHDSPNSAGIVIDAVRFAKLALDAGIAGSLYGPSAWLMKSPPQQYHDDVARQLAEDFIQHPVSKTAVSVNGVGNGRARRPALRAKKRQRAAGAAR
jgi:myo-inositol-1-phosphate synthase